ncbi:hypothetical protein N8603_03045 [Verrucomicrobiales bacterium]|nr:hypothetical protein [Verrucomicrobiales bacterium]
MKYKCRYEYGPHNDYILKIDAITPEQAAEGHDNQMMNNNVDADKYIVVEWGGGLSGKAKGSKKVISNRWLAKEQKKLESNLNHYKSFTNKIQEVEGVSFFEMPIDDRDECYTIVNYLAERLEIRPLYQEEIEFLKAWHQLKDRELGEALLTKNEMSKPKSEQGKSAFSKTAWAAGFAMQGMATQNALNDIAEDVSDISDGGGGFD